MPLEVNPLGFTLQPFVDEVQEITLKNTADKRAGFKLLCTDAKAFVVKPKTGVIAARGTQVVTVTTCNDDCNAGAVRFMLQFRALEDSEECDAKGSAIKELFKKISPQSVTFNCEVRAPPATSTLVDAPTPAGGIEEPAKPPSSSRPMRSRSPSGKPPVTNLTIPKMPASDMRMETPRGHRDASPVTTMRQEVGMDGSDTTQRNPAASLTINSNNNAFGAKEEGSSQFRSGFFMPDPATPRGGAGDSTGIETASVEELETVSKELDAKITGVQEVIRDQRMTLEAVQLQNRTMGEVRKDQDAKIKTQGTIQGRAKTVKKTGLSVWAATIWFLLIAVVVGAIDPSAITGALPGPLGTMITDTARLLP